MFYNTNRSTRAALKERELKLNGENIVSDHERLIRLQKQEKLKGLLITKFCRKYGIKKPEKKIENEVKKFVEGEKLTNSDLKKLEDKIRKLLEEEKLKTHNKNLTSLNEINAINNNNNIINRNSPLQSTVINTMPNLPLQENSFRNLTFVLFGKGNSRLSKDPFNGYNAANFGIPSIFREFNSFINSFFNILNCSFPPISIYFAIQHFLPKGHPLVFLHPSHFLF